METYQAVILGILQGLTEFLPVSSSGHLALGQYLFGITEPALFFNVSLHMGTLIAVVVVFFKEIRSMINALAAMMRTTFQFNGNSQLNRIIQPNGNSQVNGNSQFGGNVKRTLRNNPEIRLIVLIITGSIPTAFLGLFLKQYMELLFGSINFVGCMLLITGTFLWLTKDVKKPDSGIDVRNSDSSMDVKNLDSGMDVRQSESDMDAKNLASALGIPKSESSIMEMEYKQAMLIGLCQGMAVLPGISRSGATISAALFLGIDRETAAKFSFLLSIPAIVGAELLSLKDFISQGISFDLSILYGTFISFLVGYMALVMLLKIVNNGKLHLFAPYCWIVGVIAILSGIV